MPNDAVSHRRASPNTERVNHNKQDANVIRMQLLASAGVPSLISSILPVLCSRAPYVVTNGFHSNN